MSLAVVPSTDWAVATSTSLPAVPLAVHDKGEEETKLLDGIHKVWGSREPTAEYGPKFAARAKIFGGPPPSVRVDAQAAPSAPAPAEMEAGELWARRTALLMLVPDIKSIQSRDFLLAAGLMQSHLARVGIPLCVVLPVSRHARALSLAHDFALRVDRNVEVYMDSSRDRAFYRDLGVYRRTHAARRTAAQRWEAWGYWLMRGCCGPAEAPCCCVGGYGFADNSSYLGGVFLLGPGDQVHYCAMDEGAGGMKVDHDSILATCSKRAEANAVRQEQAGSTLVPI
uniref:Uncharacterized protein n=1 Tax=Cryptomonas curvata TaxID=233186 RepID=A0A7S0MDU7_9CRYP